MPDLAAPLPPPLPRRPAPQLQPEPQPVPVEAPQQSASDRSWVGKLVWLVSVVASVTLSKYLGGVYWMPVLLIAISIWIFSRLKLRDYSVWMLGVLVGHTLWVLVGHATIIGMGKPDPELTNFIIDLVVVSALTVWGLKTQSFWMCLCVLLYQLAAMAMSTILFDEVSKVSPTAAIVHAVLRAIGIGLAIYAMVKARQFNRGSEATTAVASQ
ncbi:UNVERIFIED_ORG: positive regulator of sigma E activity [Bradyrhizobium japonicum]